MNWQLIIVCLNIWLIRIVNALQICYSQVKLFTCVCVCAVAITKSCLRTTNYCASVCVFVSNLKTYRMYCACMCVCVCGGRMFLLHWWWSLWWHIRLFKWYTFANIHWCVCVCMHALSRTYAHTQTWGLGEGTTIYHRLLLLRQCSLNILFFTTSYTHYSIVCLFILLSFPLCTMHHAPCTITSWITH